MLFGVFAVKLQCIPGGPIKRWAPVTRASLVAILGVLLGACGTTLSGFDSGASRVENEREAASYSIDCSRYVVTAREARKYFQLATPEEFITLDLGDGVWGPCSANGSLTWDGEKASYTIYMGNVGLIYTGNGRQQWYFCGQKCCSRLRKVCST